MLTMIVLIDQVSNLDEHLYLLLGISRGAVHSAVSSYAAMRMVAGLRPVLIIA